jgi:hypothetical protein
MVDFVEPFDRLRAGHGAPAVVAITALKVRNIFGWRWRWVDTWCVSGLLRKRGVYASVRALLGCGCGCVWGGFGTVGASSKCGLHAWGSGRDDILRDRISRQCRLQRNDKVDV